MIRCGWMSKLFLIHKASRWKMVILKLSFIISATSMNISFACHEVSGYKWNAVVPSAICQILLLYFHWLTKCIFNSGYHFFNKGLLEKEGTLERVGNKTINVFQS